MRLVMQHTQILSKEPSLRVPVFKSAAVRDSRAFENAHLKKVISKKVRRREKEDGETMENIR